MWCHKDTGIFSAIPCSRGVNDEWHLAFDIIFSEVHFFARLRVSIGQGPKLFFLVVRVEHLPTVMLRRGTLKILS